MPVSSAVICVEGILQKNVSMAPIPLGIALYHGLANTFNILLVSETNKKELDYWLALEGLNKHAGVEYNENIRIFMTEEQRKFHQINTFRSRRYNVDIVFDPNPSTAAFLLSSGFSVATLIHSSYALPQWRPDYEEEIKPWSKIQEHETLMAKLRSIDSRLNEEISDGRTL